MEKNKADKAVFLIAGRFCPECGEVLDPEDLEVFNSCPYCNHHFTDCAELDEFVLQRLLKRWIYKNCQQLLR